MQVTDRVAVEQLQLLHFRSLQAQAAEMWPPRLTASGDSDGVSVLQVPTSGDARGIVETLAWDERRTSVELHTLGRAATVSAADAWQRQ